MTFKEQVRAAIDAALEDEVKKRFGFFADDTTASAEFRFKNGLSILRDRYALAIKLLGDLNDYKG